MPWQTTVQSKCKNELLTLKKKMDHPHLPQKEYIKTILLDYLNEAKIFWKFEDFLASKLKFIRQLHMSNLDSSLSKCEGRFLSWFNLQDSEQLGLDIVHLTT